MSKGSRAKVLFEYQPENEDELELVAGAIITDILFKPEEDGWLEGTLNGRRGVFPDNFVEILPDTEPVVEKRDKRRYARTTFSYVADNDDELSLEVGDVVEVLGEEEDGWWSGSVHGKTGVFPNNFVEEISEEEALAAKKKVEEPSKPAEVPKPEESKGPKMGRNISGAIKLPFMVLPGAGPPPSVVSEPPADTHPEPSRDSAPAGKRVEKAKVVFEYTAEADDELSLGIGDIIEITSKTVSDGWWEGKIGNKVGAFPNNFVELLPVEEAPLPKKPPMSNKVQVMPVKLTPADLKRVPDDKKTEPPKESELVKRPEHKVELPKKPEEPKGRAVPLRPVPGKPGLPPGGGPKPAAKPPAPAPPTGRKPVPPPAKRPEPPKKTVELKKEEESTPPQKSARTEPEREQPASEPPKPAHPTPKAESNNKDDQLTVAPWMKELRKRKNTGESSAPLPKPEPIKPPQPAAAPTLSSAPVSSAPPPATAAPPGAKPATAPPKAVAPTESDPSTKEPDEEASSAAVAELRDELTKLKKKLATMETSFNQEIERLELEIDEEKKARMTMQVEIDRLKRRKD